MSDFEVLGLRFGAKEEDVKKAYFTLIREYPPDKDPERFKAIRTAYEHLMASHAEEPVDYYPDDMPKDPRAKKAFLAVYNQRDELSEYDYFNQVWKLSRKYPDELALSRHTAFAAYDAKFFAEAVDAAFIVKEEDPEDLLNLSLLAKALYADDCTEDALPLFKSLYEMGVRGMSFEATYAYALNDAEKYEESIRILSGMVLRDRKWQEDTADLLLTNFEKLAFSLRKQQLVMDYRTYTNIIKECIRLLLNHIDQIEKFDELPLLANHMITTAYSLAEILSGKDRIDAFNQILNAFSEVNEAFMEAEMKRIRRMLRFARLESTRKIPIHCLEVLVRTPDSSILEGHPIDDAMLDIVSEYDDSLTEGYAKYPQEMLRAYRLDFTLCLLEETGCDRMKIEKLRKYLDSRVPDVMEGLRLVFTELQNTPDLGFLRYSLLLQYWHFLDKSPLAVGYCEYAIAYPDIIFAVPSPKNFRNIAKDAPCPCGSGKAFGTCHGTQQNLPAIPF